LAISWLAAFKAIPWSDVAANAPNLVSGAAKLWRVMRGEATIEPVRDMRHSEAISALEARLAALEAEDAQLRKHTASAAELISALAEQNARLVEAVELLKVRTRILAIVMGAVAAIALGTLVLVAFLLRA
jgi:hypothetical protein